MIVQVIQLFGFVCKNNARHVYKVILKEQRHWDLDENDHMGKNLEKTDILSKT